MEKLGLIGKANVARVIIQYCGGLHIKILLFHWSSSATIVTITA